MKVLAISCSSRRHGNTELLLGQALKGAQKEGAEIELLTVQGKHMEPCDACSSCDKTGVCHIKDDVIEIHQKMVEADGIIFGSPVYCYAMTPQLKMIIDRSISLSGPRDLKNKIAGAVVTAASLGSEDILKELYFWAVTRQMIPANFVAALCLEKGEVLQFKQCMQAAYDMGRQIVLMANQKFAYPPDIEASRHGWGTWAK